MSRSLRLSLAALVLLSITATRSPASPPAASMSTTPSFIRLVGGSGGTPDAAVGQFRVVARNLADNPVPFCSVVIDLSNCPDLVICSEQMDANALVDCAAKTVRKFADVMGEVTFTVLGGSKGAGTAATLANGARIYAGGVLLGTPSVAAFDLDGAGGVGAGDLSAWFGDFGSGQPWARSDFDASSGIGASDLSMWFGVFGAGGSTQSCAAGCP